MIKTLLFLATVAYTTYGFSQNAIGLGLVSETYPLAFWDALANATDSDLNPTFLRLVLKIDRKRAGDE